MTLWFKQKYVAPILSGEKSDTIRKASSRLPAADNVVSFAVGPRPAFARARVLSVEPIDLDDIEPERRAELLRYYGVEPLVCIRFELIDPVCPPLAVGS